MILLSSVGGTLTYLGAANLVSRLFLLYFKLHEGRRATFLQHSAIVDSGSDSGIDSEHVAEVTKTEEIMDRDAEWGRLLRSSWAVRLYYLNAAVGFTLSLIIPLAGFGIHFNFICVKEECWGLPSHVSNAILVVFGTLPILVCIRGYFGIRRMSRVFGNDTLGITRQVTITVGAIGFGQVYVCIGTVLTMVGLLHVILAIKVLFVNFTLICGAVLLLPIIDDYRLGRIASQRKLTANIDLIRAFLKERKRRKALQSFLKGEFCDELLLFYEQVERFKHGFDGGLPTDRAMKAYAHIVEEFLTPSSRFEINLPAHVAQPFRKVQRHRSIVPVETPVFDLTEAVFDEAVTEVLHIIVAGPLTRCHEDPCFLAAWEAFLAQRAEAAKMIQAFDELETADKAVAPL
mmetsp:Transcript_8872/g.28394  ORF Transcript_8872/g.28394 Transcript_8872/m.28394 type:complete len:402 (+) Transcript_8872:408-1613(+)